MTSQLMISQFSPCLMNPTYTSILSFTILFQQASEVLASGDETLEIIDQDAVEAGRFFRIYVTDEEKRKCLDAIADCPNIIHWIRSETRGHLTGLK